MKLDHPIIAIIDDEAQIRQAMTRLLKSFGYSVSCFGSGPEFLDSLATERPDCIVLDVHMPGMDGFQILERLSALDIRLGIVMMTGFHRKDDSERARKAGVTEYLHKPIDESTLVRSITAQINQAGGS